MICEKEEIVSARNFSLWICEKGRETLILDHLNFKIHREERWGIAGESGAGKSMTVHALCGLLPRKSVRMDGEITFADGKNGRTNVLLLPYEERQRFCTDHTSLIMQDSMNALNPYETVGKQWERLIRLQHDKHVRGVSIKRKTRSSRQEKEEAYARMRERFIMFGLDDDILKKYPHQISGGMKQRAAIAMALEAPAEFLIADEPTTALDAVNQRKMVDFIHKICDMNNMTLLYISHNPGILRELCTHVMVMKDGRIVESGSTDAVFERPKHPYTRQLVEQTLRLNGIRKE